MKNLPLIVAAIIMIACGTCTSCSTTSGQLTATEIAPLVDDVCNDLEAYVALGVTPERQDDGTVTSRPMTDGERLRVLGGMVALRNAVLTGLKEPRLPFPTLDEGEALPRLEPAPK